jgi:hypothetical protein
MTNLKVLETRLQSLIEVRLMSILPGYKVEDLVIQKLAAAVQSNLTVLDDNIQLAPNVFTLIVHPQAATRWQNTDLLSTLLQATQTAGQESGLRFASPPTITITTDDSLSAEDTRVIASNRVEPMTDTKGPPIENDGVEEDAIPENAFLIIEGVKVFPLKMPVVNIGRRLDNQLVIDDPRVSRNHSQLRAIKGRFVLFDLNSTGGSFVNGQRTSQSVLYPGDVISLAGVALIFGQDNPPPSPDTASTAPLTYPRANVDRPTATLPKDRSTARFKKKQ